MYAVIETGGKQYRVQIGDVVRVESLEGEVGAPVVFERVLMLGDDETPRIGAPVVDGAAVRGSIVEQGRGRKVLIYTFKRRQNSNRRTQGHRQAYTAVKIEAIEA